MAKPQILIDPNNLPTRYRVILKNLETGTTYQIGASVRRTKKALFLALMDNSGPILELMPEDFSFYWRAASKCYMFSNGWVARYDEPTTIAVSYGQIPKK